jgi:glucokinase
MRNIKEYPVVLTLDAGGTNFVFSAIKAGEEIVKPVHLPSCGSELELCLKNIIKGFEEVKGQLAEKPQAISFAFPGPADYKNGIIGDLGNLPGFRGGIALGPMLEDHFQLPVFINNDGDLFAYGEALFGLLPEINKKFRTAGLEKQYNNLIGVTLGTGFGGGVVKNNKLFLGDNGAAGEIWLLRDRFAADTFAEESISARAITREYFGESGKAPAEMTPFDVYQIALGFKHGDQDAARKSFKKFGQALGVCLADIITIVDGLVVIGGGLSKAWQLFAPEMLTYLNGSISDLKGNKISRLVMNVWDLEDESTLDSFIHGQNRQVLVPFSGRQLHYDPLKRTGVGLSKLGTSKAIALGAYGFALNSLNTVNKIDEVFSGK